MRERPTVRVLLLGPDQRILLIRFDDARLNGAKAFWATVGGGLDPGESTAEGALREIAEETGLTEVTLGPVVWKDDVVIVGMDGEPYFFHETYIVAFTKTTALTFDGWTDIEREVIKDMRWFTLAEIAAEPEQVYPEILADWLPDIIAGRYPDQIREIPRQSHERPPGYAAKPGMRRP